jgi:hypothetical protein
LIERASVVLEACVNALSGMALPPTDAVVVLGVVPAVVPVEADDPELEVVPASTRVGALSTCEEGVYLVAEVSALEPADAEADDENDDAALAPVALDDAFVWM